MRAKLGQCHTPLHPFAVIIVALGEHRLGTSSGISRSRLESFGFAGRPERYVVPGRRDVYFLRVSRSLLRLNGGKWAEHEFLEVLNVNFVFLFDESRRKL